MGVTTRKASDSVYSSIFFQLPFVYGVGIA